MYISISQHERMNPLSYKIGNGRTDPTKCQGFYTTAEPAGRTEIAFETTHEEKDNASDDARRRKQLVRRNRRCVRFRVSKV